MPVVQWLRKVFEGKKQASAERQLYKEIDKQLSFAASDPLSLGVEFELALINAETLLPVHEGPALVAEMASPRIKEEGLQHMIEVTSGIGQTAGDTEKQLRDEIEKLTQACQKRGFVLTGTGRPPTIKTGDTLGTNNDRSNRLAEERKILRDRFGALGMHMHLGMKTPEQCVLYNNFFMHFSPHLIALSASSPFEEGVFTGLASMRPAAAESMPIAGVPYYFQDWRDFTHLCRAMYRAGSIQKLKDLWWDQRPSPQYGTLEIRVCDQPATLAESMAILAFVHLLAHWFQEHQSWLDEMPRPNVWRLRENKWRAMRYGLDAKLVINNQGETRPLCDDIKIWLERLQPFIAGLDYGKYVDMLNGIMTRGNSAQRQQRLWKTSRSIEAVMKFNCDEFAAQMPLWDKLEEMAASLAPANAGKQSA